MTETPPCRDTGQWLSSQKTASATRSKTSRLTQVEDGSRFAALEPVSQAVIARIGGIEADAARGHICYPVAYTPARAWSG
jgi:hypothetical protein